MKIVVAGSRSLNEKTMVGKNFTVSLAMERSPWDFTDDDHTVLHGGAGGVDTTAGTIAKNRGLGVEVNFPDYPEHGSKRAPLIRNGEMAEEGDALLAIWDGESSGTRHMIEQALDHGLPIYVHRF